MSPIFHQFIKLCSSLVNWYLKPRFTVFAFISNKTLGSRENSELIKLGCSIKLWVL